MIWVVEHTTSRFHVQTEVKLRQQNLIDYGWEGHQTVRKLGPCLRNKFKFSTQQLCSPAY